MNTYCKIEDKDAAGLIVPFKLWDKQRAALDSIKNHRFNIVLKARQLGISWLVIAYAVHLMVTKPGSTVIALSKTQEEAKELVRRCGVVLGNMPELVGETEYEVYAETAKYTRAGLTSVFKGFPSSPSAARSFTANLIIFDEWAFQQAAREIWTAGLPTINRPTGGQVIGLSTMKLGTLFEESWREGSIFNRIFLPWDTDPRRTPEWYETTKELLGELIKQEYPATPEEALEAPGGVFFHEFRRHIHVVEPFSIPAHWRRYHAIDYGLDMLASLWAAVDDEGNCYVYREVYQPELIISEAARAMRAVEDEEIYLRYAPPDLWGRANNDGKPRIEHFYDEGFYFQKASADREGGWANLKEWLKVYEDIEGKKTARLKIFANCVNLIRTLGSIARDEKKPNDCAKEPHELTHAPDALRYLLAQTPTRTPEADKKLRREYSEYEEFADYGY
ncbi:MAG: hypothetical protein IJV67_02555 [Clostridia bacterium]|nr:hypothetical protein [Clostridia bacterium]